MIGAFHGAALAGYIVTAALLAAAFARGAPTVPRSAAFAATAALVAHAAGLAAYVVRYGEPPLVGLGPSLSTLGWIVGAFNVLVLTRREASPVALVLSPLIALLLGTALLAGIAPHGEVSAFRGAWLSFHILAALIGYAALALAFAAGLLYLIQFRELRGRRFGRIFAFFPSLDALDRLSRRALVIGFPALTLGLVLGWAWTLRFQGSMGGGNPQVTWGIITWFVFAAALLARRDGADRERRGAMIAVAGFLLVVATYLALRLTSQGRGFL